MLFNEIQTERSNSLGKDKVKYNLLGVVIAEVQRNRTKDTSDTFVLKVLGSVSDSIKLSLEKNTDSLKKSVLEQELAIVESFMPKQLSTDELVNIIKTVIINEPSFKERKNIFPYLKSNYAGQYTGEQAATAYTAAIKDLGI